MWTICSGRVKCCASVDELRQYRTAITAEGMLYQGYAARALSRERMDDAFIGRYAVTLRIHRLEGRKQRSSRTSLHAGSRSFLCCPGRSSRSLLPYFVQKVARTAG